MLREACPAAGELPDTVPVHPAPPALPAMQTPASHPRLEGGRGWASLQVSSIYEGGAVPHGQAGRPDRTAHARELAVLVEELRLARGAARVVRDRKSVG